MQRAYGLQVPQTLEEVCDPRRLALIVYDMQVGILSQIHEGAAVTGKITEVLGAARDAGVRTSSLATCRCRRKSWVCFSCAWRWRGSAQHGGGRAAQISPRLPGL
jgi:hypothetical protein